MRHPLLFAITLLLCLHCAAGFCSQPAAQNAPVVSTITLVEQRYCAASPALTSLQLKLKLRYKNVGKQKLILYRGHDLFYQTRIRSVPDNTTVKPYEIIFTNSRYFDEEFEPIEQPTPSEVFVILPPGGSYERELTVGVGVAGGDDATGNHMVREGRHTLELIVSTWYKSNRLAYELRRRWERKGRLWIDPIVSMPMPLTVEKPEMLAHCN
jgi:hypothetical protein